MHNFAVGDKVQLKDWPDTVYTVAALNHTNNFAWLDEGLEHVVGRPPLTVHVSRLVHAREEETVTVTRPKPLRNAPLRGTVYWVPRVGLADSGYASPNTWSDDGYDREFLERGLAFATEEAALACAHAIFAMLEPQ